MLAYARLFNILKPGLSKAGIKKLFCQRYV